MRPMVGSGARCLGTTTRALAAASLLALLGPTAAAATGSLRRSAVQAHAAIEDTPAEVHEKWDKMGEFLKIMFTIGCKWKHTKDVQGLASSKLKDGSIEDEEEFKAFVKKTHASNVKMLEGSCGMITAEGKKNCRQGCATRWNALVEKRQECDGKCVSVYEKFEKNCRQKAESLETVYEMNFQTFDAKKKCYESHCPKLPTVHVMEDVAKMKEEVKKRCDGYCADDKVKQRCEKEWNVKIDFVEGGIASKCSEAGTGGECFKEKKGKAKEDQGKCAEEGKKACEDQAKECEQKGQVKDQPREAQEACDARKKICETQVTEKCVGAYNKDLEALEKECGEAHDDKFEKCKEEKLKEEKKQSMKACAEKGAPKCKEDCQGDCQVDKMAQCLKNLEASGDATKDFCTDFWNLLHESSEIDPVTGDPIVLLAAK